MLVMNGMKRLLRILGGKAEAVVPIGNSDHFPVIGERYLDPGLRLILQSVKHGLEKVDEDLLQSHAVCHDNWRWINPLSFYRHPGIANSD